MRSRWSRHEIPAGARDRTVRHFGGVRIVFDIRTVTNAVFGFRRCGVYREWRVNDDHDGLRAQSDLRVCRRQRAVDLNDATTHTSVANGGAWNSVSIAPGGKLTMTFSSAGTFPDHCSLHPGMVGTVTVQ